VSVSNGQAANATTFNNAFASKISDNTMLGAQLLEGMLKLGSSSESSATGTGATVTNNSKAAIILTNGSLVSVNAISSPVDEQVIVLLNETGVQIDINNDTGATAAERIYTGTNAVMTIKNHAAIILYYDAASARWHVIGGAGGGGALANNTFYYGRNSTNTADVGLFKLSANDELEIYRNDGTLAVNINQNLLKDVSAVDAIDWSARELYSTTGSTQFTWGTTGNVDVVGNKITSVGTPTASTDAATKGYVDANGGGGINYILNKNAEADTSGWLTYADTAGSLPVDGTGGSPTLIFTRTTSSPLRGGGSFIITKDAANRQGEGASYDFVIDSADKAKVLQINFDYAIDSGAYADGDLTCYIYDVTNAQVIQPAGFSIQNALVNMKQSCTFQTASNSTSYRLLLHCASTSAVAYSVKVDNLILGPQTLNTASPVVALRAKSTTATAVSSTTFATMVFDTLAFSKGLSLNTTTGIVTIEESGVYQIEADLQMSPGILVPGALLSTWVMVNGVSGYASISRNQMTVSINDYFQTNGSVLVELNSGDQVAVQVYHNIGSGWAVSGDPSWNKINIQKLGGASVGASGAVVAASYNISVAVASSLTQPIDFSTKNYDLTSSVTTGSGWKFVASTPGVYIIDSNLAPATSSCAVILYKNGSATNQLSDVSSTALTANNFSIYLLAGEYIDLRFNVSQNTSGSTNQFISVYRLSGPSVIAASESISANYSYTGVLTITTTPQALPFDLKEYDSHGAYNPTTGVFTSPIACKLNVSVGLLPGNTGGLMVYLMKGASYYKRIIESPTGVTVGFCSGSTDIQLLAGETMQIVVSAISGTMALGNGSDYAWLSIHKVGNY
jgi:hypothetical protein